MATLVCFHAHPDDEAIATSGTMAKAAAAGHRVVLVVGTRGEHGEVVPNVLADGEQLGLRRVQETFDAAEIIGCDRVEFLGYVDSGMMGEPENEGPYSFWSADVEQAAHRLACILREEQTDDGVVLTIYDAHGGYGHPDHIQVHRVGRRAAELAGVERVFQATMNRDQIRRMMEAAAKGEIDVPDPPTEDEIEEGFGTPEADLTHRVDVSGHVDMKYRAMRAHASQISDDSFFMKMETEIFAEAFGLEWFMELGVQRSPGTAFGEDLFVTAD